MGTARAHLRPQNFRRRSTWLLLSALVAALLLATGTASPAYAKPSVSDVEKQIEAANNKLEPIVENYNRVHGELVANQAKANALAVKLQPLQLQAGVALARLRPLMAQVFESGPNSSIGMLLDSGSAPSLLNQLTMYDAIAKQQHDEIASVLAVRDKYMAAKTNLDGVVASLRQQNADLTTKKHAIEVQIANLQKLRLQVYGDNGGPIGKLRPVACPYTYIGGAAGIAARTACSQIGKPYVWAAAGPNTFDCSGLTLYAWAKAGKTLRHYTKWQWADGTPVSRSQLRPGDLVFFFPGSLHHVGMYVGGGWIVHAPHTGDVVRMARIDTDPIAGFRRP